MAGGTFDRLSGKIRPGTYINFKSTRQGGVGISARGVVLLPLIHHTYGPSQEFIEISGESPDQHREKLGYSVLEDTPSMFLIREALKNASTVIVYRTNSGVRATATAEKLTATARFAGSRGNDLQFSITQSPQGGYDVSVFLDTELVTAFEGMTTAEQLAEAGGQWITFTGTGELTEIAGQRLTGGTDRQSTNADITTFLDQSEGIHWNTLAFPMEPEEANAASLYSAVETKIRYLREDVGRYRKAVLPKHYADYEGIINVTNSVIRADGTAITLGQITAWVAGVDAGAQNTQSNTYKVYAGARAINGAKNHMESVSAIRRGEFFFSFSEAGDVVVEYDINSLVTFGEDKDETYRKNRVLRVFDTFAESVMMNFPPNKFDNSPTGWEIMEGIGRTILKQFLDTGAIKNVDFESDFTVDRAQSGGDQAFFMVGIEPVDSAEKLFFTIRTR